MRPTKHRRVFTASFLPFLAATLLVACDQSPLPTTTDATRPQDVAAAMVAPSEPSTEMTWEGCQITPACSGDDEGITQIHDGDLSFTLYDPNVPDPSPGAPGIWIAWGGLDCYLMYAGAAAATMIDQDHDGLRDECEYRLAKAFAPLLNMSQLEECAAGEPYWAAKFINNLNPYVTGDMVKLAYMPAYHSDCGSLGHNADSEFIQLTVAHNPATQHWELINSWLSAHACSDLNAACVLQTLFSPLTPTSTWGPNFEWPSGRVKSFPRIYVAVDKHANYRSLSACAEGATFNLDSCPLDTDVGRFKVWEDRNVGSARYPMRDCVPSYSGFAIRSGTECLWTGSEFAGWHTFASGVTPYGTLLNSVVFQATMVSASLWWGGSYGN